MEILIIDIIFTVHCIQVFFFHPVISVHNQRVLCKIFKICSWSSCVRPYDRWNSYVSFAKISLLLHIVCRVIFALWIFFFFYVQKTVPSESSFNALPCIYVDMCMVKTKYIKKNANSVRCLFVEKSISNTVTVEWCQMKYVYSKSQCCKLNVFQDSHHTQCAHCGLLPKNTAAGQVLSPDGGHYGQERAPRGQC